jgi:dihydrolipoamide dehydrogenase
MTDGSREPATDVVVIGAGPPGENVAGTVRAAGLGCVLIESELFGGECSYWACIPSKALLRPLDVRAAATRLPGVPVGPVETAAVLARRDWFTGRQDGVPFVHDDASQVRWVEDTGAVALRGRARLDGPRRVVVALRDAAGAEAGRAVVTARQAVVLAVGTAAFVPDVPGLRAARPWTSREATDARAVPRRLLVVGGGVVACELAQAFRGLGAEQVTVVERGGRLLPRSEPIAAAAIRQSFEDAGIAVRIGAGVVRVERPQPGGELTAELDDGTSIVADEILVAAGRAPRTGGLGLESVGLTDDRLSHGYVPVDDTLAVTAPVAGGEQGDRPWLYAVGDVNGRNLLTHMGKYQARVCGAAIAARAAGRAVDPDAGYTAFTATADRAGAPAVVFTDPQVAAVGLTEAAARARGIDVQVVDYDLGSVSGAALLADGYRGTARLVVDRGRRVVVGATFIGQDVAELLHSATVAVLGQVPLERLWHAVPSFPTISEVWLRLLEAYPDAAGAG